MHGVISPFLCFKIAEPHSGAGCKNLRKMGRRKDFLFCWLGLTRNVRLVTRQKTCVWSHWPFFFVGSTMALGGKLKKHTFCLDIVRNVSGQTCPFPSLQLFIMESLEIFPGDVQLKKHKKTPCYTKYQNQYWNLSLKNV